MESAFFIISLIMIGGSAIASRFSKNETQYGLCMLVFLLGLYTRWLMKIWGLWKVPALRTPWNYFDISVYAAIPIVSFVCYKFVRPRILARRLRAAQERYSVNDPYVKNATDRFRKMREKQRRLKR